MTFTSFIFRCKRAMKKRPRAELLSLHNQLAWTCFLLFFLGFDDVIADRLSWLLVSEKYIKTRSRSSSYLIDDEGGGKGSE